MQNVLGIEKLPFFAHAKTLSQYVFYVSVLMILLLYSNDGTIEINFVNYYTLFIKVSTRTIAVSPVKPLSTVLFFSH